MNMENKIIIAKIGGKIFENHENLENTLSQFKNLLFEKKQIDKVILIPGGGSYANFIRNLDAKLKISDDLSHWMAIFAMNWNGIAISQKYPDLKCINYINELKESKELISIFLPFDFLYQTDELPHSWDITSDSITLYIASQLGLKECYLIKDVDGIISSKNKLLRELTTHDYKNLINRNDLAIIKSNQEKLKHSQPIDSYIIQLIIQYGIHCIILNGSSNSKRIIAFFDETQDENNKIYTKITNKT